MSKTKCRDFHTVNFLCKNLRGNHCKIPRDLDGLQKAGQFATIAARWGIRPQDAFYGGKGSPQEANGSKNPSTNPSLCSQEAIAGIPITIIMLIQILGIITEHKAAKEAREVIITRIHRAQGIIPAVRDDLAPLHAKS